MQGSTCVAQAAFRRFATATLAVVVLMAVAAGVAPASEPFAAIESAGPLTQIAVGQDLSCQVRVPADGDVGEFYPPDVTPGDCGTFLAVDGQLYAPDFASHDRTATAGLGGPTPFAAISQTPVVGAGTASSPYSITTSVGTDAGVEVDETDSYLTGDAAYETLVTVRNDGSSDADVTLYRAADCYVAQDDFGFGGQDEDGRVLCEQDTSSAARYEAFVPLTGGSSSNEAQFADQWSLIGEDGGFAGDCLCDGTEDSYVDDGAGLSWSDTIPVGESRTYSSQLVFGGDLSAPSVEPSPPPPPPPPSDSSPITPTRACAPVRGGVGKRLLASLRCTAAETVLEAKCAVGIVTLVGAPLKALKAAEVLKTARGLYDLRRVPRRWKPLARLLNDLHRSHFARNAPRGWRTESQVYEKLTHLKTARDLMRDLPSLSKAVRRKDFERIAVDVADIAGVKACVQGLVDAVSY
jgi:hypothetical protein